MKKAICILLFLSLTLSIIVAVADGPSNANIIEEYKSLITGEWKLIGDLPSSPFSYVYNSLSLTEDDYGTSWMLFVSSANVVYLACQASEYSRRIPENMFILSLNEDASFMMLYREGNGGIIFKKESGQ